MNILHLCPSKVATGGTESIHNIVSNLNKQPNIDAKILYVGATDNPQPKEYEKYGCGFVTTFPSDYEGVVIFPEIWGNQVIEKKYDGYIKAISWAGVDVYDWHTPKDKRGAFLQDKNVYHIAQSLYAEEQLGKIGVDYEHILPLCGVLNDRFFEDYEEVGRENTILYNPVKMTSFQEQLMQFLAKYGYTFMALKGLTRDEMINTLRKHKLYIDFGVFSGRERIPREAVRCGCCVITSNIGASSYYRDVPIQDKYKFDHVATSENLTNIMNTVKNILENYDSVKYDFDEYRKALVRDREMFQVQIKEICNAFLNNNTGI